jgi:hypothetical protein
MMFTQLYRNQAVGKLGRVDGWEIELRQNIRQRTNVILVPMSNKNAVYPILLAHEIRYVGNDQIYAQHLIIGEHQPCIHNEDIFPILNGHHILADFAKPPKRHNAHRPVLRLTAARPLVLMYAQISANLPVGPLEQARTIDPSHRTTLVSRGESG